MAFYPAGAAGNPQFQVFGVDDTIGSILPGPIAAAADGAMSLGGSTTAGTGARFLTNYGFPTAGDVFQSVAGAAYNTSVAATNIQGTVLGPSAYGATAQAAGTLQPGRLNLVGRTLRVRAFGSIANTVTPNLTMAILLGTNVIVTSGVQATATITGTSIWRLEADIVCRTAGASGVLFGSGLFSYFTTGPTVGVTWQIANPTPFTGVTLDLTAAYALNIQATWGTSSASNNMTCHQVTAEILY